MKRNNEDELKTISGKLVELKKGKHLSLVYRYPTKDITKNIPTDDVLPLIADIMNNSFLQAELHTIEYYHFLTLFGNGKSKLRQKINDNIKHVSRTHDHEKNRLIASDKNIYLRALGVTNPEFRVKSKMSDKYKQINKYAEIIDDILKKTVLPEDPHIVDMGSGKGYLTFALYDYFENIRKNKPHVWGVEIRKDLVDICNRIAKETTYENLHFIKDSIQESSFERIDFLLALHACDTATDDAIYKGIQANAKLIVCAPCCHRQVRKNMNTTGVFSNITKHGILMERQAETLTDTIRAMILEAFGYKTRVFEFISTSHTPKNVMIVASKYDDRKEADPEIVKQIQEIKNQFGIKYQHLEKLTGMFAFEGQ
ncbi:SAM-dependent methyltransferase [Saprospiraceae bacterium]|nr:SAM-dependent methyltransferase [Saprospiraceae bacterium]